MEKEKKYYYYFCRDCKKSYPREFKKLKYKSFCEMTGKNTWCYLITKTKI